MKNIGYWVISVFLVIASATGLTTFAYMTASRELTDLENVLLQFFFAAIGYVGTFLVGRESARNAAKDVLKPYARSAFRRLVSLYRSHQQMASIIEASQDSRTIEEHQMALARLEGVVLGQIGTADAAMEDWRDIVPEDVEELYRSARRPSRERNHD